MSVVSVAVVKVALNLGARAGIDVDALVAGLSFDRSSLRWRRRVPWDDYVAIVERLEAAVGGPEGFEAVVLSDFHRAGPAKWRQLLRSCLGPASLARFMFEVLDPLWYPGTDFVVDTEPDGRMRVTIRIREGRGSLAVMRGAVPATRNLPLHFGMPPATVDVLELTDKTLVMLTRFPMSQSVAAKARASAEAFRRAAMGALGELRDDVIDEHRRTAIVADLGRELAQHVDLDEVADALVAMAPKLGLAGMALHAAPLDGGALRLIRRYGDLATTTSLALSTAGRDIGRLDVDGGDAKMLADLVPWLSLAVDNARTFGALAAARRNSAGARVDVATRTFELTPRQAEVLAHVVSGASNKEIANALDCAENTVEMHMTQLLRKAQVQSRAQLIARVLSSKSA